MPTLLSAGRPYQLRFFNTGGTHKEARVNSIYVPLEWGGITLLAEPSASRDCRDFTGFGVSTSLHQAPIEIWATTVGPFCFEQTRRSSVPGRVQWFVTDPVGYNQPYLAHGVVSEDTDDSMS